MVFYYELKTENISAKFVRESLPFECYEVYTLEFSSSKTMVAPLLIFDRNCQPLLTLILPPIAEH